MRTQIIMERQAAEAKFTIVQNMARRNEARIARGAPPMQIPSPSLSPSPSPSAAVVDDDTAPKFLAQFDAALDEGVDATPAGCGFERIRDRVFLKFVSHEEALALAGDTPARVAYAYRLSAEEMDDDDDDDDDDADADAEEGDRLEPGSPPLAPPPFKKAVDVTLGEEQLPYYGAFKVAIAALITKFYPALLDCQDVSDLLPPTEVAIWGP
ncbi:hypothetical protein BJY01DRAFT_240498 [Aspergillus pseudoustus]|uniref:Uncharacterized protein n=1 Tax=Aspergillus pseudoustus TaxID=1810923 RepID=A0ABR4IQT1_9EURO